MSFNKTNLTQVSVSTASGSLEKFSKTDGVNVPLVCVPAERWWCSCAMNVPSGPYCIEHRWGKDAHYNPAQPEKDALAAPGLMIAPACRKIAYCVAAQAQTYNAPVKSCPTADNVMVDCDLTLVFIIGPKPHDVKQFVYKLGARRFDEFLFAAVEEAIRHLIRTCMHTEVYELRGNSDDRVRLTQRELNKKFMPFGVSFQNLAITEVRFKKELQDTLQSTTEYKSKMDEQQKSQRHAMEKIQYQQKREMVDLDRTNERIIQNLQAERERVKIDREKERTAAVGRAEVAGVQAEQAAMVAEVRAESEKEVAKTRGLKAKEELIADAKALDQATRIKVKQECDTAVYESLQRVKASQDTAAALVVEAEAEAAAAASLKVRREHDLALAKMEVLQALAANSKMVISGDNGDRLINAMLADSINGAIKLT